MNLTTLRLFILAPFVLLAPALWAYDQPKDDFPPNPYTPLDNLSLYDFTRNMAGEPFDMNSGEFNVSRTLLSQKTAIPLEFKVSYSTAFESHTVVGLGWTFNYNMRLYETDDILLSAPQSGPDPRKPIVIRKPNGRVTKYTPVPNQVNKFVSYDTQHEIVTKNGDGTYTMVTRSQMTYFFDSDGKLSKISDGKGAELRLTYDPAGVLPIKGVPKHTNLPKTSAIVVSRDFHITRVEEFLAGLPTGIYLSFGYDPQGRIHTVSDQTSRSITLRYDDVLGDLLGITDPIGAEYIYAYFPFNRLMIMLEGRGCPNCNVMNISYDANGRVSSQSQAIPGDNLHGYSITTDYNHVNDNTPSSAVTYNIAHMLGTPLNTRSEQTYWITDVYGSKQASKRIVQRGSILGDADDYVTRFEYDLGTGFMTNQVDPSGRTNFFIYDSVGNLTNETHFITGPPTSYQHVTEYVYDDKNNLRTNIVSQTDRPNEKYIIIFEYDPQNRLLAEKRVVDASAANWTYLTTQFQYDTKGRLTQRIDPRGNAIGFEYNDPANPHLPTREFDPANSFHSISRTYDPHGNKLTQTDQLGHITSWEHDPLNRVTKITDPLSQETHFTYVGENLTEVETGRVGAQPGRITRYEYYSLNFRKNTKRVDDNNNEKVLETFTYDSHGNVLSVANALGQTTFNEYDPMGWLLNVKRPYNATETSDIRYEYDNAGRITSTFDPLNVETRREYDLLNRVTKTIEAYGTPDERTTEFKYNALNQVLEKKFTKDTSVLTTTYTYDGLSRLKTVSGDREYPVTYAYDENGNVISVTDGLLNQTQFQYDAYNRKTRTIYADHANYPTGNDSVTTYDEAGNVVQLTDGRGNKTYFHYDALNRLTDESIPFRPEGSAPDNWWTLSGNVLKHSDYNPWNEVTATSDIAGGTTSSLYNRLGQMYSHTTASGLTLTYAYNDVNKVTSITYPAVPGSGGGPTTIVNNYDTYNVAMLDSVTDRANNTTAYPSYDKRFNKLTETSSLGATTTYHYDNLARVDSVTDQLLNQTLYAYDQFNQITQITHADHVAGSNPRIENISYDPFGKELIHSGAGPYAMTYTYDAAGNPKTMTDGNNHQTSWDYDSRNRVSKKTYADNKFYSYTYDEVGNLASRTDAKSITTTYGYNRFNLLTLINYPNDPDVSFFYDSAGRRNQMVDGSGTTSWTFDSANRILTSTQSRANQVVTYTYGAEDQRLSMDVRPVGAGSGRTTTYGYDTAGRLKTIADPNFPTAPFTYNWRSDASMVSSIVMPNGAQQQKNYDVLGRLQQIKAQTSASATINSFTYDYDKASQRKTETWADNSQRRFTYDANRQLSTDKKFDSGNNPDATYDFTYNYDPIGNFTTTVSPSGSRTFTPNNVNQYTAITAPSVSPTYDDNGSMLTGGSGTYAYDQENRLIHVDRSPVGIVDYLYDGLGRLVERTENGTVAQRFVYDGELSIAELDGNNSVMRSYTRGLDLSQSRQGAGGAGGLLAWSSAVHDGLLVNCFYFYDGNGNVVDILDYFNDTIDAHYLYDPFGKVLQSSGTLATLNSYRFSTKYADDTAGLVYYGHRFYNATLGRWINRDPMGERGGLNLYGFVGNNPTKHVDRFGKNPYKSPFFRPPTIPGSPFDPLDPNSLLYSGRNPYLPPPGWDVYPYAPLWDPNAKNLHGYWWDVGDVLEGEFMFLGSSIDALLNMASDITGTEARIGNAVDYAVLHPSDAFWAINDHVNQMFDNIGSDDYLKAGYSAMELITILTPPLAAEFEAGEAAALLEEATLTPQQIQKYLDAAKDAFEKLGKAPGTKTVAGDVEGTQTLSGWTERPGYVQTTDDVFAKAEEIGHEFKENPFLDQGEPGRYNASHAEKQASVLTDDVIAVSQSPCGDCQNYFRALAQAEGRNRVLADPDFLWVFKPDGSLVIIPR